MLLTGCQSCLAALTIRKVISTGDRTDVTATTTVTFKGNQNGTSFGEKNTTQQ